LRGFETLEDWEYMFLLVRFNFEFVAKMVLEFSGIGFIRIEEILLMNGMLDYKLRLKKFFNWTSVCE